MTRKPGRRRIKRFALVALLLAFFAFLFWVGRDLTNADALDVSFYQVKNEKIENRMRIVQLSDLHLHEFGVGNERLLERIKALSPDMIAVTGDMNIAGNPDEKAVISLCAALVQIAPTYYSLGNHEYTAQLFHGSTIMKEVAALGVTVVDNDAVTASIAGNEVLVVGLSEDVDSLSLPYKGSTVQAYIEGLIDDYDGFSLLLAHYPHLFSSALKNCACDLALAGHAHGGQVRLPVVGALYAPDQSFFPKLTEGQHNLSGGGQLIISRGLGNSSAIPRFNNNCELVVIDVNCY